MPNLFDFFNLGRFFNQQKDLYIKATQKLYEKNLELYRQTRRVEIILNTISEAILDTDENFNIKIMNRVAIDLFGVKDEKDLVGKYFFDLVKFRTKDDKDLTRMQILEKKEFDKDNYLIITVDSKKIYSYFSISEIILDNQKREYMMAIRDVTVEKELERTKNDFISVTSHELRTPMTIIKSYLWMLQSQKGGTLTDKQKEYLEKAVKGTERMLNLINDTLNISRIEQGRTEFKYELINYPELLRELGEEFKIKTDEKKLAFKLEVGAEITTAYADKNKLREILTNFVGNSVKFTQTGGITIKVEVDENNNSLVKTTVVDTGKGIAHEDIVKLFHKFSRLDNSYQIVAESGGTGLGLYIVKSLAENMGGNAGAFSEGVGKGSTFWFTLPIKQKENTQSGVATQTNVFTPSVNAKTKTTKELITSLN